MNILYIDIETAPQPEWDDAQHALYAASGKAEAEAPLYPEFSRVTVIAYVEDNGEHILACYDDDERRLLVSFANVITRLGQRMYLCGHNIKGFDAPFLRKRYLAHGLLVPLPLRAVEKGVAVRKPWELPLIDTQELYRGTGGAAFTSLAAICHTLAVPSPKGDVSGATAPDLWRAHTQGDAEALPALVEYCKGDVAATRAVHHILLNA